MEEFSAHETKRLRDTILQLRELDGRASFWRRPKYRVFGSKRHCYELLPTLTEAELGEFEAKHGIVLPPDYRAFLKEVGNGRVGPSYGLATLEEAARAGDLSRPFALTRDSNLYSGEELTELGFDEERPGALPLCHHGCGMFSYLVVNGPTYGTLWFEDSDLRPTGQGFLEWYSEWAEGQWRGLLNEPLVDKIRKGMTKAEVIEVTGGDWQEWVGAARANFPTTRYFVAVDFRARLTLNEEGRVVHIKRR